MLSTCTAAVDMWAAEKSLYITPAFSESTGHYSQIIWRGTTAVGCGFARCSFGGYVVCRYSPAGNVLGQFALNAPA